MALIGENDSGVIVDRVLDCAGRAPGAFEGAPAECAVRTVDAVEPKRLVPDPAGYFVIYPDARNGMLLVEHFTNQGVLDCVLEGRTPSAPRSGFVLFWICRDLLPGAGVNIGRTPAAVAWYQQR